MTNRSTLSPPVSIFRPTPLLPSHPPPSPSLRPNSFHNIPTTMSLASSFLDQEKKGRLSDDPSASEASTSSAPPSYAHSRDASKPPPDYPDPGLVDPKTRLPKTFRVGSHDVAPRECQEGGNGARRTKESSSRPFPPFFSFSLACSGQPSRSQSSSPPCECHWNSSSNTVW